MTFVPDTSAWFEPYVQMGKFSLDNDPKFYGPMKELVEKCGGRAAVDKIEYGFDASDKTIDWLREQLESDFPGKKLVFVKDLGASMSYSSPPLYDKIPKGFRHTFLMRHPGKLFNVENILKMQARFKSLNPTSTTTRTPEKIRPYQYLHELWEYVKAQGLEVNPIIIDSDDLLRNPKAVMEAYCKELGIPYSEDLLTWEAGDEVMTKHWMVPKQTILTYRAIGMHDTTFSNTGFTRQVGKSEDAAVADNKEGEVIKDVNQSDCEAATTAEELALAKQIVESILTREIPFYEEMYADRLIH